MKPIISNFKQLERIVKPHKIFNVYHFKPLGGFSIDSRTISNQEGFVAVRGRYFDGHNFIQEAVDKGAAFIAAEKYIPTKPKVPFFVVGDSYNSLGAIAAYIRKRKNPFLYGITGSVGKTITKEILSFCLEPHFKVAKSKKTENNALGVAKAIFSLKDEKAMVLELGTNAKGEIGSLAKISRPDVGIVTFIKPVHLEGLGDLRGILEEKISLFEANLKMKIVLNRDDPYLARVKSSKKIYWFGKNKANDLFASLVKREQEYSTFLIQNKYKLLLPRHREGFIANFLAAILGAHLSGISLKSIIERLNHFQNFPSMRMEMKEINGFFVLNDAYNANPYSLGAALKGLGDYPLKKIAVIGDMLELGKKSVYYHELLASKIAKSNLDYCLTFGDYAFYLREKLQKLGYKGAFHFSSHEAVARFIKKKIGKSRRSKKRYLIFLKGSRKMELEKVVNYLAE